MAADSATGAGSESCDSGLRSQSRLRIFAAIFAPFFLTLSICGFSFQSWERRQTEGALQEDITRDLTQRAQKFAQRIDGDRSHGIDVIASQEGQAAGARATVIDKNGNVLADSEIPIAELANEGRRPEFVSALRGAIGEDTRSRNGARVLFVAAPVSGGAVRLAYPLADIEIASAGLKGRIVIVCAGLALVGLVAAAAISCRVGAPHRRSGAPPAHSSSS